MIKSLVIIGVLLLAVSTSGQVPPNPDHTLLWNSFMAVKIVNQFAVGISTEGVAVMHYDADQEVFVNLNEMFFDQSPVAMKLFDDLLIIKTVGDSLIFISLDSLPSLRRLGAFKLEEPFADFAYRDNNIYVSRWFEGVWRYSGPSIEEYEFVDSTMLPVLATQVDLQGDTLLVLDEYNGVVQFLLDAEGLMTVPEYLLTPFICSHFIPFEDQLMVGELNGGVYLGEFGLTGSGITDTISVFAASENFYVTNNYLILAAPREVHLVGRFNYADTTTIDVSNITANGDIFYHLGRPYLLVPDRHGSLLLIDLLAQSQSSALKRPGPVSGLVFINGLLFTGGEANPIDVYAVKDSNRVSLRFTMYDYLRGIKSLAHNGDTLIALLGGSNRLAFITQSSDRDEYLFESAITLREPEGRRIEYFRRWTDTSSAIIVTGKSDISTYTIGDSSGVMYCSTWDVFGEIYDMAVKDSILFVSTDKNMIIVYRIHDGIDVEFQSVITLATPVYELIVVGSSVVYFDRNMMHYLNYSNPDAPVRDTAIALKLPVASASICESRLYTVGSNGFAIYDFTEGYPELITYGGRSGTFIAADSNIVATSNGKSLHIYYVSLSDDSPIDPNPQPQLPDGYTLSQNYPNPFNPITAIDFTLPAPSEVEIVIFNTIGQEVATLISSSLSAGYHTVYFDASSQSEGSLATGVYYYRLTVGDMVQTRKMLLLK